MEKIIHWVLPIFTKHKKTISVLPVFFLMGFFALAEYMDNRVIPTSKEKESIIAEQQNIESKTVIEDTTVTQKKLPKKTEEQSLSKTQTDQNKPTPQVHPKTVISKTITKVEQKSKIEIEEDDDEVLEDTIVRQYIYTNTKTTAYPHQILTARINGEQVVSPKSPEVRIQLLQPLQLATFTLPQGSFLMGKARFEDGNAYIEITRVRHKGKNHTASLFVTNNHGDTAFPISRKSKLKFENTSVLVETDI